ncbi:MAG TPA: NAD(P)-dependent oxidoreductase [Phototrophicaceae bacterium]|jgi:3-hydroxyisobutyrate dehydrogenase|nr:NAD(P)-dependent oxidoreductase [Phototrophicaceae bacterium]
MQKVTVLGLGIMGGGIASNLLKKGFPVTVYNRTRSKAGPLAAQGATIAESLHQAVETAEVVISVVGDDTASRETWTGVNGALAGVKPGTVLIESSTLTPDWVRELAALAFEKQCKFLDAPLMGSRAAAAVGQLGLLIGGDAAVIDQVKPVLEAFSVRQAHLGATGAGATYKLITNMMTAIHVAAVAEGLTLAEKAGLNMEQVAQLIQTSPTYSPVVQLKLPRMMENRYEDTDFSLKWMLKDIGYALDLGEDLGVTLKTASGAHQAFGIGVDKGLGEHDMAVVVEGLRK